MTARADHRQSGVGLIEVLVAVLVLSIGLLGLAGVQLISMRNSNSALSKVQANTLGNDILDRMRANRGAALDGDYDTTFEDEHEGGTVALDDLSDWKTALSDQLPGGQGEIDVDDAEVLVTIRWVEDWAEEADDAGRVNVQMRSRL